MKNNYYILSIDFGSSSIKICYAKSEFLVFSVIKTEVLNYDFVNEAVYNIDYNILSNSKILKNIQETNPQFENVFIVSNIDTKNIPYLSFIPTSYVMSKNSDSSYLSLISEKEKYDGTIVIDLGKSTSTISSYLQSKLVADDTINVGQDEITKAIGYKYSKTFISSENLKMELGCAYPPLIKNDTHISIIVKNECIDISYKDFSVLISSTLKNIFLTLKRKLNSHPRNGYYSNGIILIGGGALLNGSAELAKDVFKTECRIGFPLSYEGLDRFHINPIFVNVLSMAFSFYKNK